MPVCALRFGFRQDSLLRLPLTVWRLCLAASIISGPTTLAQIAAVRGRAFDSLAVRPLTGADVFLEGSSMHTSTDSLGFFHFDGLRPGAYVVVLYHEALQRLGVAALRQPVTLDSGTVTIAFGVPSIATIWRRACGSPRVLEDSGVVFGTIRDAITGSVVAEAEISVSWIELRADSGTSVVRHRWQATARSASDGGYSICGVPFKTELILAARSHDAAILQLLLEPSPDAVQRVNIRVRPSGVEAATGIVVGVFQDEAGHPVPGVRVSSPGLADAISDSTGRTVSVAPVGTRQFIGRVVGREPHLATVDVGLNDTSMVVFPMHRLVTLDPITVTAMSVRHRYLAEIVARQFQGFGRFIDSAEVARYASVPHAISMQTKLTGVCAVFLDGLPSTLKDVRLRSAADIALIEVQRSMYIPSRFRPRRCQSAFATIVLIWTKNWLP